MRTWTIMKGSNYVYSQGKMRIVMISEAHEILRASLRDWVFTNFATFHLLEARTAEEAVSLAKDWQPEVILMDEGRPRMKELDAIRCMKRVLPDSQVVVVTTYQDPGFQDAAVAAGADVFIATSTIGAEPFPTLKNMFYA